MLVSTLVLLQAHVPGVMFNEICQCHVTLKFVRALCHHNYMHAFNFNRVLCVEKLVQASLYLGLMV